MGEKSRKIRNSETMEKQKQMITAIGDYFASSAEHICDFIEDPDEREVELNKLRELALEHAKLEEDFDVKKKTLVHVTQKLDQCSDLELEKTYDIAHEGYKQNRLDEEYKADSNAYKALEKKIKEKMKEKNSKEDEQN